MREYACTVKLEIAGNNLVADNRADYINKVKALYLEEYNIRLSDNEIVDIIVMEEFVE